MKSFTFIFVVFIINCCDAYVDNTEQLTTQMLLTREIVLKSVKQLCYQNSTESYRHFVDILNNATKCMEGVMGETSIFLTAPKTFKDNIQNCVDEFVEEMENCLPEESKDWPQLNFEILYSFLDYLHENREEIFSPEVAAYVKNCSDNINKIQSHSEFFQCFKLIQSENLETKVYCQQVIEVERCLVIELDRQCPSTESIDKLKEGLLIALKEPCAEFDVTDNPMDNVFTILAPYEPPNINPDLM